MTRTIEQLKCGCPPKVKELKLIDLGPKSSHAFKCICKVCGTNLSFINQDQAEQLVARYPNTEVVMWKESNIKDLFE